MEEWRNGGMGEGENGGMREWGNGRMEEWRNGESLKAGIVTLPCLCFCTYILPLIKIYFPPNPV